jgi:glycosyltransferase involved in cell wall biosynthesis
MACGKPVFSYINNDFRKKISREPILPNVQVETVEEVIENLIALYHDRSRLKELGLAARQCMEDHYSFPAVSKHLESVYRDAITIHRKRQRGE